MTSTPLRTSWPRQALPWLLLLVVGLVTAVLRYEVIQSSSMLQLCESSHGSAWCTVRQWLVLGFLNYGYGIAALVVTALALMSKQPWVAWLAAALGLFAVELYCYEPGALALLIGCLRLLRIQTQMLPGLTPAD